MPAPGSHPSRGAGIPNPWGSPGRLCPSRRPQQKKKGNILTTVTKPTGRDKNGDTKSLKYSTSPNITLLKTCFENYWAMEKTTTVNIKKTMSECHSQSPSAHLHWPPQRQAEVSLKRISLTHVTRPLIIIWVTQNTQNSSSFLPNWPWWLESPKVSQQCIHLRIYMRLDIKKVSSSTQRKRNGSLLQKSSTREATELWTLNFCQKSEPSPVPRLPVFWVALKTKLILTSWSFKSFAEL